MTSLLGRGGRHSALEWRSGRRHSYRYLTTGQAWADYDRDGWIDLYVTDQAGSNTLYRNSEGKFAVSPRARDVALPGEPSGGAVFADYDNDGWPDLYVAAYGRDHLFHNEGGRGFSDVTRQARITDGGHGMTASWADYDGDAYLDLYVANYGCAPCDSPSRRDGHRDRLFHNEGDGTFSDATSALPSSATEGFGFVAGWLDYDDDRDLDLYLVNDVRGTRYLPGNFLFRNDGPGCDRWCFTDVSDQTGAGVRVDGMGLAVSDYDGDGRLDMFITNTGWAVSPLTGPAVLLRGTGTGFQEVGEAARADVDAVTWGSAFLDYDNDTVRDLFVGAGLHPANLGVQDKLDRLLRGSGGGFSDVSATSGASFSDDTLGVATADFNNDGLVDLVTGNIDEGYSLYANNGSAGQGRGRLSVRLRGDGPVNRDAVGSRVRITTSDGRSQMQEVMAGSSLGAGSDLTLHFGLGRRSVMRLQVRWPDGREQVFEDMPRNSLVGLTYGRAPRVTELRAPAVPVLPARTLETNGIRPGGWVTPALVVLSTGGLLWGLVTRRRGELRLAHRLFVTVLVGASSFQVVHFIEHLLQMVHWIERPGADLWITPWGLVATDSFTQLAGHHGGRATGTELLHLGGNWIFLVGLIAGRQLLRDTGPRLPGARALAVAFWLQLIHVLEHVALTSTWLLFGTPRGISTGFGLTLELEGAWAPSIRAWWHFSMNLAVTAAAVVAIVRLYRCRWLVEVFEPPRRRSAVS